MGLTDAVDAGSAPAAAAALVEFCAESVATVAEVPVEETEEMVEVTEDEEDDTDVSEVLPEFNSSCIVDKTRQVSIRPAKCLDVGWTAAMRCNARERLGGCVRTSWLLEPCWLTTQGGGDSGCGVDCPKMTISVVAER